MKKTWSKILCAVLACGAVFATTAAAEGTEQEKVTSYGGKVVYDFASIASQEDWAASLEEWGDNVKMSAAGKVWWWGDQKGIGIDKGESITFKFDLPDDATEAYLQSVGCCLADQNRKASFYISKDGTNFTKMGTDGTFVPWCNVDISSYLEDNAPNTIYIKLAGENVSSGHDAVQFFLQVAYSGCAAPQTSHPKLDTEKDDYKQVEKYLFTATDGNVDLAANMFTDGKLNLWGGLEPLDAAKTLITDYGYKYESFGSIAPWASPNAVFFFDGGLIAHQPAATGGNSFIFEVPVKAAMQIAELRLNMAGTFDVGVSLDGKSWSTRAFTVKPTDATQAIDITDLLDGTDKTVYVRVAQQDIAIDSAVLRAASLYWEEGAVLVPAETTTTTATKGSPSTGGAAPIAVIPVVLLAAAATGAALLCRKKK